jgi:hypothetical protein
MKRVLVAAVALTLILSAVAFAGNNPAAKVAVHVRAHSNKAGCTVAFDAATATCLDFVTTEASFSADCFPVFYDLVEFLGCEYGLCWPSWTYSGAFSNCADLVIGEIKLPGDGASHTWTSCQAGVAVPSFVWLYADGPGLVCPCPNPETGLISVLDCAEGLDSPVNIFCAGVYGMEGDDPCDYCDPSATEASTWGGIKGMFE